MVRFHGDPENPARIIVASGRGDEIGIAERELAAMQIDLVSMLQQKNRLAALGLAVSSACWRAIRPGAPLSGRVGEQAYDAVERIGATPSPV